jgi:hypothetical protein
MHPLHLLVCCVCPSAFVLYKAEMHMTLQLESVLLLLLLR